MIAFILALLFCTQGSVDHSCDAVHSDSVVRHELLQQTGFRIDADKALKRYVLVVSPRNFTAYADMETTESKVLDTSCQYAANGTMIRGTAHFCDVFGIQA